ncbi:hypothetical protein SLEP1_g45344 [Rubroshorea leprosula]|uniref:Uncharacterized protein n=1 Tax=Rubroshorea leprosula TaxID=152421 RepID=A0AAV5LLB4_9ROSI|nr:hypothetical protein SLEP1_g45344 [Rubroshorea leprosula]
MGFGEEKKKNERLGGSSKQTRSEKFINKITRSEKLLKQKHHFFKHAHSTIACTFPNGLSPLVKHFKMQKVFCSS